MARTPDFHSGSRGSIPLRATKFIGRMANHLSAKKRIRQSEKRRLYNKYYAKTARTFIKRFRALEDKAEAEKKLPEMYSTIDKLVRRGIIHKNKAANLKSKLTKKVQQM